MIRKFLPFIIIIVVIAAAYLFYIKYKDRVATTPTTTNHSSTLTSYVANPMTSWSNPVKAQEQTMYGNLSGEQSTTQITSSQANITSFGNIQTLQNNGFTLDNNLAAGGAGSSVTGYKRMVNGKSQVIIYSYETQPTSTNPNEPLQFNCPCKVNLKVFLSEPFDANK